LSELIFLVTEGNFMKLIENNFTRHHLLAFLAVWLSFTILTYLIAERGIEQDGHNRLVALTACGTILGPMTGAISRNCQSCCLRFSLGLIPYCAASLIIGAIPSFLYLPFRGASILRMTAWVVGLLGWFLGAIVSFGHALS
jgi:hypothetical protein